MATRFLAASSPLPLLSYRPRGKKTMMPLAASSKDGAYSYQLQEGQSRLFHRLPSGLAMEVISQKGRPLPEAEERRNAPLVFVHGSFHAAWCWAEHWLPYFSDAGHDCYALSLLGQGESDVPSGAVGGTLQTHTSDIADFIRKEISYPPVLVGHSFGGLIVQSYVSNMMDTSSFNQSSFSGKDSPNPQLSGAVLLCSVPPSGNSGLVLRYLLKKPIAAIKVTLSLAAQAYANSLSLCKETFFSSTMEEHLVLKYQQLMRESSKVPLFDLRKLNASLPVSPAGKSLMKLLVIGASDDFIVDATGLQETADFYNVQPVCLDGVAHDIMIDSSWEKGAQMILSWLRRLHEV